MLDVIKLFMRSIATTVVGSLPVENPSLSLEEQVKNAVRIQTEAGIDILSTGQVSMFGKNMIDPFLQTVAGLEMISILGETVPVVKPRNKIKPLPAKDLKECDVVQEIRFARKELDLLANNANGIPLLKASVTGPNTILNEIPGFGLGNYNEKKEILNDLCDVIRAVCQAMLKAGADCIQIDEPILSHGEFDDVVQEEVRSLGQISKKLDVPHGLGVHVCGELNHGLFKELTRLEGVDFLDFEFHLYPNNFKIVDQKELDIAEHYGTPKILSVGVISSTYDNIETKEDTIELMTKAIKKYGADRVVFDPDCGLRSFKPNVASSKLEVLCQAARKIRRELSLQ